MRHDDLWRIFRRLLILFVLTSCLFVATSPMHERILAATCLSCDENRYTCDMSCDLAFESCQINTSYSYCLFQWETCKDNCYGTYSNCLNFCTFNEPPPGGGGGSQGCSGQFKTPCQQACYAAKLDCIRSGSGTTCGEDFTACMNGCCR